MQPVRRRPKKRRGPAQARLDLRRLWDCAPGLDAQVPRVRRRGGPARLLVFDARIGHTATRVGGVLRPVDVVDGVLWRAATAEPHLHARRGAAHRRRGGAPRGGAPHARRERRVGRRGGLPARAHVYYWKRRRARRIREPAAPARSSGGRPPGSRGLLRRGARRPGPCAAAAAALPGRADRPPRGAHGSLGLGGGADATARPAEPRPRAPRPGRWLLLVRRRPLLPAAAGARPKTQLSNSVVYAQSLSPHALAKNPVSKVSTTITYFR